MGAKTMALLRIAQHPGGHALWPRERKVEGRVSNANSVDSPFHVQTREVIMRKRSLLAIAALALVLLLALAAGMGAQGPAEEPPLPGEEPSAPEAVEAVSASVPIQGRLVDSSGIPVPNGTYSVTFRLYAASTGGVALCSDHDSVPVQNGLFSEHMEYCSADDINGRALYLGIQVGSDAEMTPRQAIYPVPYAWSLRPGATISGTLTGDAILHVENWGSTGRGVRAYAMDQAGVNYAFVGRTRSPSGYAGFFSNDGGGTGVYASSSTSIGGDGVVAESRSDTGRAVFARNYGGGIAIVAHGNSDASLFHMTPSLLLVQEAPTGDFIIGATGYGGNNRWRVNRLGRGFFDAGTQTGGADFAEQLPVQGKEADYEPGDVLVISASADRTVELAAKAFDTAVIGVYSTEPAVLAGVPGTDDPLSGIPVAITGIAPCKVSAENGPIRRGDLLVTSATPGHAMRAGANPPQGTVVGKALGELAEGTGTIQVLVTLQ